MTALSTSLLTLPDLFPGTTDTSSVKKLQDALVAAGYMTQAQVQTGYGVYGPQTTAAVAKWQSENNIPTGNYAGYFGPASKNYILSTGTSSQPAPTPAPTPFYPTPTGQPIVNPPVVTAPPPVVNPPPAPTTKNGWIALYGNYPNYTMIKNGVDIGPGTTEQAQALAASENLNWGGTTTLSTASKQQVIDTLNSRYPYDASKVVAPTTPVVNPPTSSTTSTTGTQPTATTTEKKIDYSPISNLGSLQYGSTNDTNKKLQDWLVKNGYMTQTQVDTGYGTYGPQTKAAVAKLQQKLGMTVPPGEEGFFGPLTNASLKDAQTKIDSGVPVDTGPGGGGVGSYYKGKGILNPDGSYTAKEPGDTGGVAGAGNSDTTTTNASSGLPPGAVDGLVYMFGWTPEQANAFIASDPASAKQFAVWGSYLKKQQEINGSTGIANKDAFLQSLEKARIDPEIKAKYGDIQNVDTFNFNQSLANSQFSANETSKLQKTQFENEQKALADKAAEAGLAFSGFREQAKGQLGQQQEGVITSSRASLQQELTKNAAELQAKYGTLGTSGITSFGNLGTPTSMSYMNPLTGANEQINANLMSGDIQGTLAPSKTADVLQKAESIYSGLKVAPSPASSLMVG